MLLLKPHDKIAIVWKDDRISYVSLLKNTAHYASQYPSETVSRVAIFAENRPEWIYAFYSAWYQNAVAVPIDYLSSPAEVAYILEDCHPEIIFCSRAQYILIAEVLSSLSLPVRPILFEDIPLPSSGDTPLSFPLKDKGQTAMIIYTSGTTGSPKGVMLSFDNIYANIEGVSEHIPIYNMDSRVMILLPLHHTFPLVGSMVAPLAVGATVAVCPSLASEHIMATLQQNKITIIIGVPRFYHLIRKGIKDKINQSPIAKLLFKLAEKLNSKSFSRKIFAKVHDKFGGSLKHLVCGGAAIDIEAARDYQTLGFEMLEGFGMTEAAPMITFTRPGRRKLGSPGECLPGTEIQIRDGEVLARGRNIMLGYFNRPDETAEVIKDGWLYTGDLGYLDKQGFLFITGRKKEIIVLSNGKNINPQEIEMKLENLSQFISEIGVYHKNDQLHCLIFPDFDKLKSEEVHNMEALFRDLLDRYNMTVSSYKKIMKSTLSKTELPKTRLGKIKRFMLDELANAEVKKKTDFVEPPGQEYQLIKDFLVKNTEQTVHPSDHLEIDLGLDSLDKVNFLAFLQASFGIEVNEALLAEHATVEGLASYFAQNKKTLNTEKVNWSAILKENLDISLPRHWITHIGVKYFLKGIFTLYFRLRGEGMDNIPFEPCIITPNHQSYFDGFFITALLKNVQLKKTYFYAKEKHINKGWQRFLASRHNVIIMDINKDLKSSLQKMAAALSRGKNIIIFPEGTRTKDGTLGKFKKSFAILSKELNVPVIPVTISGAFEALPTGGRFPKLWQKISVTFSKPIYPAEHSYDSLQNSVFEDVLSHIKPSSQPHNQSVLR